MVDGNNSRFISIDDFHLIVDAISVLANFKNEAPELVTFLNKQAHAESMANLSKTFLLITNDQKKVHGYFSISTSEIARKVVKAPHGTTYSNVPSALIGRLARDIDSKGHGVGEVLLFEALKQIVSISNLIGLKFILTDAKNNKAQSFYESYGFKAIKGQVEGQYPLKLYLPIDFAKTTIANY
jgi:predicted GNAT family N-acyltransferase